MALQGNTSDKKVVGRDLYTGLANMKVEFINPTKEQLIEIGLEPRKDPVYTTDETTDEGKEYKRTRVEFHLRKDIDGKPLRARATFFITDQERISQKGKHQFINKFGMTAWPRDGEDAPSYEFYSQEGMRKAHEGEEQITDFLKAWLNVKPGEDVCQIDDVNKIAHGNLSELHSVHKMLPGNEVKVLLGVSGDGYQTTYTRMFGREYDKSYKTWLNKLADQYGAFTNKGVPVDYQNSLEFQVYTGNPAVESDSPSDLPAEEGELSF